MKAGKMTGRGRLKALVLGSKFTRIVRPAETFKGHCQT